MPLLFLLPAAAFLIGNFTGSQIDDAFEDKVEIRDSNNLINVTGVLFVALLAVIVLNQGKKLLK